MCFLLVGVDLGFLPPEKRSEYPTGATSPPRFSRNKPQNERIGKIPMRSSALLVFDQVFFKFHFRQGFGIIVSLHCIRAQAPQDTKLLLCLHALTNGAQIQALGKADAGGRSTYIILWYCLRIVSPRITLTWLLSAIIVVASIQKRPMTQSPKIRLQMHESVRLLFRIPPPEHPSPMIRKLWILSWSDLGGKPR